MKVFKFALTCLIVLTVAATTYAQSLSGKSITELKTMQKDAVTNENYALAEKIKNQLKRIEGNKAKIEKLEEEKKSAILIEDYAKAELLENQIEALKNGTTPKVIKKVTPEVAASPVPTIVPPTPQPIQETYSSRDADFFKNGLYMDGYAGLAFGGGSSGFGLAYAIGNKWYFGSSQSHQMGFQARWGRVGMYTFNDELLIHMAPVNVGFINLFKISESAGIETNFNFGYSIFISEDEVGGGLSWNPEIKYRYKKLSVGLDYLISNYSYTERYTYQTSYYDYWTGSYQYQNQTAYRTASSSIGILSVSLGLKF